MFELDFYTCYEVTMSLRLQKWFDIYEAIRDAVNENSIDAELDIPDYILAEYLIEQISKLTAQDIQRLLDNYEAKNVNIQVDK